MMQPNSNSFRQTVFVVDDDVALRDSLSFLFRSEGQLAETYGSASEFLDAYHKDRPGCLVLDIDMPGASGLELRQKLQARHSILPIIFIVGHSGMPVLREAMRVEDLDFIQKPFRDQELFDRVNKALAEDSANRQALSDHSEIRRRLATLTPREREVLDRVVQGKANKPYRVTEANRHGAQPTVYLLRARVMDKMRASSLEHLARMVLEVE